MWLSTQAAYTGMHGDASVMREVNGNRRIVWRDSSVVRVLDLGSEGPRFEPIGRRWSRNKRGPVTQPSILKRSVNEYWLRLGRLKAGMCDAA